MSLQKILVIDQDEMSHFLTGQYLKKILKVNRIIVYLTSPKQINCELNLDDFFLIITEIRFPRYDAFEFIKQTKAEYPTIKIVVVTASYNDTKVVQQAKAVGADDILAKPLSLEKLRDALAQLRLVYYSGLD